MTVSLKTWRHASAPQSVGWVGSVANLVNTITGAAFLDFAYQFSQTGAVLSSLALAFVFLANVLSLAMMIRIYLTSCEDRRVPRRDDFQGYILELCGPALQILYDVLVVVSCLGSMCIYFIIARTSVEAMWPDGEAPAGTGIAVLVVFGALQFPLSAVVDLKSQVLTSVISIVTLVILMFVVVGYAGVNSAAEGNLAVPVLQGDAPAVTRAVLETLSVFSFAFTSQTNAMVVFAEAWAPPEPRALRRRLLEVSVGALSFSFVIYFVFGYVGYVAFGSAVGTNVILSLPFGQLRQFACMVLGVKIFTTFPFVTNPMLAAGDGLVQTIWLGRAVQEATQDERRGGDFWTRRLAMLLVTLVGTLLVGYFFDDLSTITTVAGCFSDNYIAFLIPALALLGLFSKERKKGADPLDPVWVPASIALAALSLAMSGLTLQALWA